MNSINYYTSEYPEDPSAVDFRIEYFWVTIKNQWKNFYIKFRIGKTLPSYYLNRIDDWSSQLNILKKNKEYLKIQNSIERYLSIIIHDMLIIKDSYSIHLLKSSYEKWKKIKKTEGFKGTTDENILFMFLLFELYIHKPECRLFKYLSKVYSLKNVSRDDVYNEILYYIVKYKLVSVLDLYRTIKPFEDTEISSHKLIRKLSITDYNCLI